jgi:CCR4-NOT transcription complex subunit 4
MSDNMSITSTNAHSRAGSPPPFTSKVGSAPIRTKTKSQQKKDRQERAKMIEQEMAKNDDETKSQPEIPAQEAILSRKKKAKREKEPKLKPVASTTETKHPIAPKAAPKAQNEQKHNSTSESTVQEPIKKEVKPAPPVKSSQVLPPAPPTLPTHREPSPPPTPTNLSAALIIADLKAHTPEIQKCIEQLFKVTNHNAFKYPPNFSSQRELAAAMNWRADFKLNLTKSEVDDLLRGRYPAINYSEPHSENNPWERGMVTASGAHLRALTKELESRFVELEQALREIPEEFRFRPGKPQNETKFPHMDLVALQREYENLSHGGHHGGGGRGPNVMEQMVQDGANMRKGAFLVDEASRYINEFVMPPVTPPPSVGGNGNGNNGGGGNGKGGKHGSGGQQGGAGNGSQHADLVVPSLDVAERQLNEAKRHAEEREVALKKQMKKNKKLIGISA